MDLSTLTREISEFAHAQKYTFFNTHTYIKDQTRTQFTTKHTLEENLHNRNLFQSSKSTFFFVLSFILRGF